MRDEMLITCQWFYGCNRVTHLGTFHNVMGINPICEQCAEFARIRPEYVLEIVKG